MVKLSGSRIDAFLGRPDPKLRAVLVYGPDVGLVRERAAALVKTVASDPADPFRVADLTPASLKDEPTRLLDEAAAMSLTGGRRVVRLRQAGNAEADLLADALEATTLGDSLIVVEAGALGPRDRLRKLFEDAANAAALPCYADEGQTLEELIRGTLGQHGLQVDAAAMSYLIEHMGGDRGLSRSALEKLALYKGAGSGTVTLEDAESCIGDDAPLALEDIAFAAAGGNIKALERALERGFLVGETPVGVLRAVARHLQRLHLAASYMARGQTAEQAVRALRPPVFVRHQPILQAQLRHWTLPRLGQAMTIITDAELSCKSTGMPAHAICGRALLQLAAAARPRRA